MVSINAHTHFLRTITPFSKPVLTIKWQQFAETAAAVGWHRDCISGGGLAQRLHIYCFERHYGDKSDRMLR
jgi:hypothetical protein